MGSGRDGRRRGWNIAAVLVLVVLTLALYWPVQGFDFVNYDDEGYVTRNRQVRAGLTGEGVIWAFTDQQMGHWHPLTWLSHMLDSDVFSLNPAGHHWTSVLIHLVNALLLLGILERMTGRFWRSLLVALLFALHPLNVESVAWIAERKNVLSTLFWFLTLWAYWYYLVSPSVGRYMLVVLAFVCGLLSKPMVVTLPFVLLLLDFWPLGRLRLAGDGARGEWGDTGRKVLPAASFSRLVVEKLPLFALIPFSVFMTLRAAKSVDTVATMESVPFSHRLMTAVLSYVDYIGKMVWPHDLAVFYPYPQTWSFWEVGGALLLIVVVSGLVLLLARRRSYLAVGWFWYLGTLVPVIGLVQAGGQAMADRYAYVPLIGLFVAIVWGIADWIGGRRFGRIAAASLSVAVILAMIVATTGQLAVWRNSITLFEHALAVTVRNDVAHGNLGKALMDAGRLQEAARHYGEALRIKPGPEAHNNLGMVLAEMGQVNEAMVHYREALTEKPSYAEAYSNIGVILGRRGNLPEAIRLFEKALSLKPEYVDGHNNIGYALVLQGKYEQAIPHYETAIRLDPDHVRARRNLGVALMAAQRWEEAVMHLKIALQHSPGDRATQLKLREALSGADQSKKKP